MPPRKSTAAALPAVTVEVVPVDPDAGVTFADHRAASAMMLRALAGQSAETALERLRVLYASLPNGTARRAVLATRLAILRDDMPEPVKVAPPPPVVEVPVMKAPLKAGALSTLALDAAAKLLFDADAEDEDEPPPPPKSKAAPPVADLFAALAAADDDDADPQVQSPTETDADLVAAEPVFPVPDPDLSMSDDPQSDAIPAETEPEAEVESAAKPTRAKGKQRKAKPVALDPAAIAALMGPEDSRAVVLDPEDTPAFVPMPPAAMASALSGLSALDEDADLPNAPRAAKPTFDLGAAFAAFDESEDAPVAPADDQTQADAQPDVEAADDAALTALAITKPQRRNAAKPALPDDDIAASLSALIAEGESSSAPAMAAAEVSDLLGATEPTTAEADQGLAPARRKRPTNLSDVSAAFAAMNSDEAD